MTTLYAMGDCLEMFGDVDDASRPNPERPCTRCGKPIGARRKRWCSSDCASWWADNHNFSSGRFLVKRAAREGHGYRCALCGNVGEVEVDHIERAFGRHGKTDCIHHVANLRALCLPCHRERTRAQRATAAGGSLKPETHTTYADPYQQRPNLNTGVRTPQGGKDE